MASQTVQRNACAGRPRRYDGDWDSANARIYLSKATLSQWRIIRGDYELRSDNEGAVFLLKNFNSLKELQSRRSEGNSSFSHNG